jgi:hypothetical protein
VTFSFVLDGAGVGVAEGLVLSEAAGGVLHLFSGWGVDLVEGSKILGPDLMDDVGTIRLVSFFFLEKS